MSSARAPDAEEREEPLTVCTAGHVDHGKTALVAALTGVDTDRLPEERERGLTIVLGYAPVQLPSGRRLSLIDVPGHERFVRTMVSGASGTDLHLSVVAADDGVMPQTVEHAEVLRALGVHRGVVAVTKADLADPARAAAEARELFDGCATITCSARTGEGVADLLAELERVASGCVSRARAAGPPRLHVDRVFTVKGRGTVLTGTLWSGTIALGDALELAPSAIAVRVRGLQVHDRPTGAARAGQRVAVNVVGPKARAVQRGELLTVPGAVRPTRVIDCSLRLRAARRGERVQVHHGTRAVAGRLVPLEGDLWQLRLEQPLLALAGDRLVVRRQAPPDTLGGGTIIDADAARHGARSEILARLRALTSDPTARVARAREQRTSLTAQSPAGPEGARASDGARAAEAAQASAGPRPSQSALAELERRLLEAGSGLLSEAQLADHRLALAELRRDGRAVRVSGRLYGHREVVEDVRSKLVGLIEQEGSVTLAGARDRLGLSRKTTQAFLEHLDSARITRRLPDDRRVLARTAAAGEARA